MVIISALSSAPSVSIIPPLVAVVPGDITVTLQCVTNSPSLRVEWLPALDGSLQPLSRQPSYTANVPGQGGFPDGHAFYCVVRDPENTGSIVGAARTSVQNIAGKWCVRELMKTFS